MIPEQDVKPTHALCVISLILTSVWLAWTVLVDFFVVPSVFQNIPEVFMAGNLGVVLFSKLNHLEFPIASILFALAYWHTRKTGTLKLVILTSFVTLGIAAIYLFSLTPKLASLTAAWEYAEKVGTLGPAGEDVQQLHQNYHRTYVALDSVKLLLLLIQLTVLGVFLSRRSR
jgi:hypothetical protein